MPDINYHACSCLFQAQMANQVQGPYVVFICALVLVIHTRESTCGSQPPTHSLGDLNGYACRAAPDGLIDTRNNCLEKHARMATWSHFSSIATSIEQLH